VVGVSATIFRLFLVRLHQIHAAISAKYSNDGHTALGVFVRMERMICDAQVEADSGDWLSEEERRTLEIINEAFRAGEEHS